MGAPRNVMGLAQVLTGWSGTLSVTVGATTVPIVPATRTSAIVLARAIATTASALDAAAVAYASSTGVLSWESAISMRIDCAGVIRTRLDMAASTSGTKLGALGAHLDGLYPEHGIQLREAMHATTTVASIADGSGGVFSQASTRALSLEIHGTLANVWTYEAAFSADQVWDLWHGSTQAGRLRVDSVTRKRLGKSPELGRLNVKGTSQWVAL